MAATFLVNYKNNLCPSRKMFVIKKKKEKSFLLYPFIYGYIYYVYMEKDICNKYTPGKWANEKSRKFFFSQLYYLVKYININCVILIQNIYEIMQPEDEFCDSFVKN